MKKFLSIFLAVAVIFSFASCTKKKNADEGNGNTQSQTQYENSVSTEAYSKDEKDSSEKNSEQSSKNSDEKSTENGKSNNSNANSSKKPNNSNNNSQNSQNNNSQNNSQTNNEATDETQKPEPEYIYCTVEIDCSDIVKNKDNFNKEQQVLYDRYVDGKRTILSPVTVKVKNKSSAYKAVELACKQNGIKITKKNSGFGVYVVGFDGINEKMFGQRSGWLYYVNSKSPSFSSSAYELKDGDKVSFVYTCKG